MPTRRIPLLSRVAAALGAAALAVSLTGCGEIDLSSPEALERGLRDLERALEEGGPGTAWGDPDDKRWGGGDYDGGDDDEIPWTESEDGRTRSRESDFKPEWGETTTYTESSDPAARDEIYDQAVRDAEDRGLTPKEHDDTGWPKQGETWENPETGEEMQLIKWTQGDDHGLIHRHQPPRG